MNISTQQLRYFMEVGKCLNFTRAAANLYVTQPTLSQQIAELEAQLGVTLFERNSRSVSLTPAGAILYKNYPDLTARLEQIREDMLITAAGFRGSLRVGFLDAFMDSLPIIMREFRNAFPDVSVMPICGTHNELTDGLKNRTMDVIFSMIQDFSTSSLPFCSTRLIQREPLCFVLPGEYPASSDYSFAQSLPLVIFGEATDACYFPHIQSLLKELGISAPDVIFTDSLGNMRAYLESGVGFSVLPLAQASFFSPSTQFIPIPGEQLEIGALWDPASSNPALPLFLDVLEQHLLQQAGI